MRPRRRPGRGLRPARVLLLLAGILALGVLSLALPIASWRTGEIETEPLALLHHAGERPARLWIDTDAACGLGPRTDPDDCLALHRLAREDGLEIVGISTVFGNAPLARTDRVTREIVARLRGVGAPLPEVSRGASAPLDERDAAPSDAQAALARGLRDRPLIILALGPLTTIAETLRAEPALARNVERIVAVMGRRPGHLFHPSEGQGGGVLLGHGPVFSDMNLRMDSEAVRVVLATGVPLTLLPYEVARQVLITREDLARLSAADAAGAHVASAAEGWLAFWRDVVGLEGFYPFDLVAAHAVIEPDAFLCAEASARVELGWAPRWLWMIGDAGLLVTPRGDRTDAHRVRYCPRLARWPATLSK
ncbi:nucleoside hydrolase [Salinarimonas rosea]|uniref:nucleoside hydrolase n=1 Tax=Salinarimonas rosea TaxID=552063 RepID=UPI00041637FD|nr:nucleoside hydrolase [Salinarimonas rosea]